MAAARLVILAGAAAVLLAGCEGGAPAPAGGSAPGPAGPSVTALPAAAGRAVTLNCGLAPASLVGPALGLTGLGAPQQQASGYGVICVYSQGTVTVGMANDATAAMMRAGQASMGGWKTSAYPGLGDEAFSGTLPAQDGMPAEYTLHAREGSLAVTVLSAASLSAERSLVEQLFAKAG
jgi:hypothetical protein